MLNLNMVGRLRDDVLIVKGAATAADFARLLAETNRRFAFHLTEPPGGYTPTDQATFYARGIPAIDFFTGKHPDYHEPTDTFDKLNIPGMRRVEGFIEEVAVALADGRRWPTYVALPLSTGDDRVVLRQHSGTSTAAATATNWPAWPRAARRIGRAFAAAT